MRVVGPKTLLQNCADTFWRLKNRTAIAARGATAAQHIDTFHRGTLLAWPARGAHRALPPPGAIDKQQDARDFLDRLVDDINAPQWCIPDMDDIETELTQWVARHPTHADGYLWRGILKRIMGADPRSDLRQVLRMAPDNRLAALNMAAAPLTCMALRHQHDDITSSLRQIERYLDAHPGDAFAELIHTMLLYLGEPSTSTTVQALEDLYLRYPSQRAMTTAVLAAVLQDDCRRRAAEDFAHEALQLGSHSALAHNILIENRGVSHMGPIALQNRLTFPSSISTTGFELAFMAPYAQQDSGYLGDGTTL